MASALAAILARLQPRRHVFLCLFTGIVLCCGYLSSQLSAGEDILALVPDDDSRLAEQFSLFRDAPFLSIARITVGGEGTPPQPLAQTLAAALQERGVPLVGTGPGRTAVSDPAHFLPFLPSLLSPGQIAAWGGQWDQAAIRAALRKDRQLLLGPSGPALRGLLAMDPLRLHEQFLSALSLSGEAGSLPSQNGYFTSADGRYCLVVARPSAAMTDAAAGAAFMDTIREAIASLPPGTETIVTGSHRHSEANAAAVKSDLSRVLPVSFLLIFLLFAVFIREKAVLAILAVPLAALCLAGPATAFFHGRVSGIVLGFGSVILGITADYAIHTYYAVTRAENLQRAFRQLLPSLLAGACTTACAFGSLFFSGMPAIRQVAVFGLSGLAAALVAALFVLPLLLAPKDKSPALFPTLPPGVFRPAPAALLAAFLGAAILLSSGGLSFDGDIRHLSHIPPDLAGDEQRDKTIWKTPAEGAFIVASAEGTAAGFEKALQVNDAVREILRQAGLPASGLGPFLPSRKRQDESRAAWKSLWAQHGEDILTDLEAAAEEAGFAANAFRSFRTWIAGEPPPVTPEILRETGLGFLPAMFTNRTGDRSLVYTVLPAGTEPEEAVRSSLAATGADYLSGSAFRAAMAETMRRDILRFSLLTLASVCVAVFLVFRSPRRCLAVLIPMLAGLASTLALFRLTGTAVNMFHTIALPLVIALSIDYGIFMQAVLEGRMDRQGRNGVLLSALTTLAGFGSLLLARHPALFSLGMAVSSGIASALASALWLQPLLFAKKEGA